MSSQPPTLVKHLLPLTRLVFAISVVLAGIAGIQLYVLATRTDRYFAWTIGNPLSAAFLGTGFWAGTILLLFAFAGGLGQRASGDGRGGDLRSADGARHADAPRPLPLPQSSARRAARCLGLADRLRHRSVRPRRQLSCSSCAAPGGDPPNGAPVPDWVARLPRLERLISLIVGLCLTLIPHRVFTHWPWRTHELTAQTVGAGFLTIGVASVWFVREKGWVRGRVGTVPYLLIGALQFLALLRFHSSVEWGRVGAWLYLLYVVGILVGASTAR